MDKPIAKEHKNPQSYTISEIRKWQIEKERKRQETKRRIKK